MYKKIFIIFTLLLLNNCVTPGSALLGPVFTAAKTGSIYQASLSYSTGKIMNKINSHKNMEDNDYIYQKKIRFFLIFRTLKKIQLLLLNIKLV